MPVMSFAAVGGITLHYNTLEGSPAHLPLAFVNSLGTDLRIWDRVIAHLSSPHPLIRHDLRGHGLSDAPPGPYTIAHHADDLVGLLDILAVDRAVLIGISVGGMIALDTAARYPQKVKALVLCDTAARIGTPDYWDDRIQTLKERGMEQMAETIVSRWFAPQFPAQHPGDYQGYLNMFSRMPLSGYTATCAALGAADLRASVASIKARTLVLGGAQDLSTAPELVRGLAESLPDARFELIENAGHLTCSEQPQTVAAHIDRFLKELS